MDARVRYTKRTIRESFLQLLQKKPLQKITVCEICKAAEINRATFYKYYANPYDLLQKLELELLDGLEEKLKKIQLGEPEEIFRTVLNDIQQQAESYCTIFSGNGDTSFRQRVFSICYSGNMEHLRQLFPAAGEHQLDWLYHFTAEGCNGILSRWIAGGMQEPVDDVVMFLTRVILAINTGIVMTENSVSVTD